MSEKIPETIASGTFLLVGSGETYFTEFVKGPDVVTRMLVAMFGEDNPDTSGDERGYWEEQVYDLDNWCHDADAGPVNFKTDIGETDHIELIRIFEMAEKYIRLLNDYKAEKAAKEAAEQTVKELRADVNHLILEHSISVDRHLCGWLIKGLQSALNKKAAQ